MDCKIIPYNSLGVGQSKCKPDQFQCQTGVSTVKGFSGPCIPKEWENDGSRDCMDGSDENSEILYVTISGLLWYQVLVIGIK